MSGAPAIARGDVAATVAGPGLSADKRLRFIDGLRGVAAALVMLYHLGGRTTAAALTHRGYLGVAIFFALSGFVITSIVSARPMSRGFLGRFALRRLVRLDLPYWANILLVLVTMRLAVRFGASEQGVSAPQVAAHLVYLQDILGYSEISSVYWTLCFEVQFYLALALLLWSAQKLQLRSGWFIAVFLVLMGLSVLANMKVLPTPRGLMFSYWWAFALGGLCYWSVVSEVSGAYLAASCAVLFGSAGAVHGDWRFTTAATVGLMYLAWRRSAMHRWLADPVSQFLGRISYSLYLCHPLFGWSAQSLALRYCNQWVALGVGVAASIVSAWLTYWCVERPAIALSHRVRVNAASGRPPNPVRQVKQT